MRRRHSPTALALWAVAGLLVLFGATLFGYGQFGGTTPTSAQPHHWDSDDALVVAHRGALLGEERQSWCEVTPTDGEQRRFEGRRYHIGELRTSTEQAWFTGTAEVTCTRAAVLTGPLAPFAGQWFTVALFALVVAVISVPVSNRYRRRHGSATDAGADERETGSGA